MSALDDYLPCPPLTEWLPQRLGDEGVFHVVVGRGAPRPLVRFARRWPLLGPADRARALVVVGVLERETPRHLTTQLDAGTRLVDLAVVGRWRLRERLLGIDDRRRTRRATARRLEDWLGIGLVGAQQWVTTDPPDTVVTLGTVR